MATRARFRGFSHITSFLTIIPNHDFAGRGYELDLRGKWWAFVPLD
jgi:hypothetical protein